MSDTEKVLRALRDAGYGEVTIAPDGTITGRVAPVRAVDPQQMAPVFIPVVVPQPYPYPAPAPYPWWGPTVVWGGADNQLPDPPAFTVTTINMPTTVSATAEDGRRVAEAMAEARKQRQQ